jgi:hypothetical protein
MPNTEDTDAADLRETIAKQKITDVLTRYSRGIDRCDIDTLSAVFWPDATADYGSGRQNARDWARATVAALKGMHRTQHAISNMLIDIHGDTARAETYCQAYHEIDGPSGRVEMVVGGRYLDRLERRDGAWRIADRTYVMDWNRNIPSTAQWDEGIYAGLRRRGGRLPDDPLNDFLAAGS